MSKFLGIDHPLIVVRDIELMRDRYSALGFTMTPIGKHPWGTSTSLAMFDQCLLELMSVYDERLIDLLPAGDFRFGRTIRDHLSEREGISLVALHSEDAAGDLAVVQSRGIESQGLIEFGRDVTLPDGRTERTATTLAIVQDQDLLRFSHFICHQHRPDLIYVPKWLNHANGATGICQVTILASPANQPRVRRRLAGLYGEQALLDFDVGLGDTGFGAQTGNGRFVVQDHETVQRIYGPLPPSLASEDRPCCVAIHVRTSALKSVFPFLETAQAAFKRSENLLILTDAQKYGNVFLAFE